MTKGRFWALLIASTTGAGLLGGLVSGAVSGRRAVMAETLRLTDGEGRPRMILDGSPGIQLLDERGKARLTLSVLGAGRIDLLDSNGSPRARLFEEPGGRTILQFFGPSGHLTSQIGVNSDGRPRLDLSREGGETWSVPIQ